MLIICNGAQKSGSSWLVQLVRNSKLAAPLPPEFRNPGWKNPSFDKGKEDAALSAEAFGGNNYYVKQHWFRSPLFSDILAAPHVRILNIVRDIRDTIVSRYYHKKRLDGYEAPFEEFIERDIYTRHTERIIEFHASWHMKGPSPFLTSYEAMQEDFDTEALEILQYLGVAPEALSKTVETAKQVTAFENLPNTGDGKHLRKGVSGDWRNHMTPALEGKVLTFVERHGYADVKRSMARQFPRLEKWLSETDIGL